MVDIAGVGLAIRWDRFKSNDSYAWRDLILVVSCHSGLIYGPEFDDVMSRAN